jgi:glycosyltransferase involved in cell wall biosynthesis
LALKPFRAPAQMLFSKGLPGTGRHGRRARKPIVFDLSRLLSRAYHLTPTGIDRVEYAYAVELLNRVPDRLRFAAVHPAGGYYGRLEIGAVRQFLAFTQARWQSRGEAQRDAVRTQAIRHLFALRPRAVPVALGQRVYLQASPHHLEDGKLVRSILQTERARFVNLVHDVIPLTYPEFARPNGAVLHARRLRTIDRLADGIIANSHATLAALEPHLTDRPGRVARVAHLGCEWSDPLPPLAGKEAERPYFLCIGTIEPRKNHLLLLNVWRRLAESMGDAAPRLVLIGRRGWENENVIDLLERSVALRGHVVEQPDVDDRQLTRLLAGARGVLLPSFAEGYGMPVAEALATGVPVICSDISALREAGGDLPDYLDPLDGVGWLRTILDYAKPDSPMRAAQCERMRGWAPMSWSRHMDIVLDVVEAVADQRR